MASQTGRPYDESDLVLANGSIAPLRDSSRRDRSFTVGSQRSFGTVSPQPGQGAIPARPSLDHAAARAPSVSNFHDRQTSHATDSSAPRPHGSPASVSSVTSHPVNKSIGGAENNMSLAKGRLRVREGSSGALFASGSPEPITGFRKSSTADSSISPEPRIAASPNLNSLPGPMKVESVWSERTRRDLQVPALSRRPSHQKELKSAGDFALEHLFNSFVVQADSLVIQCSSSKVVQPDPRIESICGPGVDTRFDQVLYSLGYVARNNPQTLIERTLQWGTRHNKDSSSQSGVDSNLSRSPVKPSGESSLMGQDATRSFSPNPFPSIAQSGSGSKLPIYDHDSVQAERRRSVVSYILCRALIEIFGQSSLTAITLESAHKLETIVYDGQVRSVARDILDKEPMKSAKWDIATQLLGIMARIDFDGVTSLFLQDLKRFQRDLAVKGNTNKAAETEAIFMMKSMRHIKLNPHSEGEWTKAGQFMFQIADLFANVHGQAAKTAYCKLVGALLLSATAGPASSYDRPAWRQLIHQVWERLTFLSGKPKYWQHSFVAQSIALSVCPTDIFLQRWQQMVVLLPSKFRERQNRGPALKATCRIVWSYLSREQRDAPSAVSKNLEDIAKSVLYSSKRLPLSAEPGVAEPLIQLIRIIGFKHQEFCFKHLVFPLINSEIFSLVGDLKDLKIEQLDPDRMVIGVRAFLTILTDLENGLEPPYPAHFDDESTEGHHQRGMSGPSSKARAIRQRSLSKPDSLSKPVVTTSFSDLTREYYARFCEILGKIAIICDNTFGGQAVLDEKFSSLTPKTPIAETLSFNRREDTTGAAEERYGFYDLLRVAIQGLPRCLTSHTPLPQILNLLCTGTAHIEKDIAASSAQALQAIAKQGQAQTVVAKFSSFILNYDNRYSTMSDGGMLGPNHIEDTLTLYVTLLKIWIEELQNRSRTHGTGPAEDGTVRARDGQFNSSAAWSQVDRVESQGLFFLCSPSPRVRTFAVDVLRLVTNLDSALGKEHARINGVLLGNSENVFDPKDDRYSLAERSRLEKAMATGNSTHILVELCSSTSDLDISLWLKIFPKLIQAISVLCPMAVAQTREDVCARISQMQSLIEFMDERPLGPPSASMDSNSSWIASRSVDLNIEQWKLYLMFACTTITKTGVSQSSSTESHHSRKGSKSSQTASESITTASELFAKVIPQLSAQTAQIRNAAVVGLGAVNINLYKTLLESLESFGQLRGDLSKKSATHQRAASSPRRFNSSDFFITEVAHVYQLTCYLLQKPEVFRDEWIVGQVSNYAKDLLLFLQKVEEDEEYLRLRVYYCGLKEGLFKAVELSADPQRWMTFQTRRAAYMLMEGWSGLSSDYSKPNQVHGAVRQEEPRRQTSAMAPNAAWANELKSLRMAALNAMATLCGGPISIRIGNNQGHFDVSRIFKWIDNLVNSDGDRLPAIGRRALQNLLAHNPGYPYLFNRSIQMLYIAKTTKGLESYLDVISEIFTSENYSDVPAWRVLSALLFILGNKHSVIRVSAARLLRLIDEQHDKSAKLQELDISIADKTFAVNRKAQFEISTRLSKHYPSFAFFVFAEFSVNFKQLSADNQRTMVGALLPWIQTLELVVDPPPQSTPTADSYMLLVNLLDITISCSGTLPHEIAALWKALATGPHGGNVQVVLDFIIDLSVEWRDGKIIDVARQVVVYMADTPAGQNVIEYLLQRLKPKHMWGDKQRILRAPPEANERFEYVADLSVHLRDSLAKQERPMALGQLCLVFLVDLIVSPVKLHIDWIPILLQAVLALWDQIPQVLHEPAREMLVHLIHELVISKMTDTASLAQMPGVEKFVELVRRRDCKVIWSYDDNDGEESAEPPEQLAYVIQEVTKIFSLTHPEIRPALGRVALDWATQLPVRHLACRSLQIYRCILSPLDQKAVSDLLGRLAQTACDQEEIVQAYALELLRTFRTILSAAGAVESPFPPQLFWTLCACLGSVHELEFAESLDILEVFLDKFDLADAAIVARLVEARPSDWWWPAQGFTGLILRGCRSGKRLDKTLQLLDRVVPLPSSEIVGGANRVLFSVLANLPRLSQSFETHDPHTVVAAVSLATAADNQGYAGISSILDGFSNKRFDSREAFLKQILSSLMATGDAQFKQESLIFLMGFLTNSCTWYKSETLRVLELFVPNLDLVDLESDTFGPDLISPLLRLLQTNLCSSALKVLDYLTGVSGGSVGKEHLQMSMAGSRSSRALRQEYDRTTSLFGIPEESGWSVPEPAVLKETTRSNLNSLLITFPDASSRVTSTMPTPDVEFYKDEHAPGSYFPRLTTNMTREEVTLFDTSMSELVTKLDSLDDFFDTPGPIRPENSPPFSVTTSGAVTPWDLSRQTTQDTQPDNGYNTSFESNDDSVTNPKGSFSTYSPDPPTPALRESPHMSPSAFRLPPKANGRPGLGARSTTAAAVVQRTPPDRTFAVPPREAEPFSDDDLISGRAGSNDRTLELDSSTNSRPAMPRRPSLKAGVRSSLKRLTGGGDKHRTLSARGHAEDSPEVPKVPSVYLANNPKSSEP